MFDSMHILTPTSFGYNASPPNEKDVGIGFTTSKYVGAGTAVHPPTSQQLRKDAGSYSTTDLGLLHHFTFYTAPTIGAIQSELYSHIWSQEVPRLAQSHAFLMHAVLAFAAAHQLSSSDVDPLLRNYSVVRQHYSSALSEFREAVNVITEERAEALLCFSILTTFLSLYLDCGAPLPERNIDTIDGLITFLRVVQNSTRVLEQVHGWLRSSTIGVLLSHTWKLEPHAIEPDTEQALFVLDDLAHTYLSLITSSPDSDNSYGSKSSRNHNNEGAVLFDGLAKLRELFSLSKPTEKEWRFILHWPIKLDPAFVELVRDGHPIALCALAHWCVPIYHAPPKWFTGDFAERTLRVVVQRLRGTQWEEGVAWPIRETIGEFEFKSGPYARLGGSMMFY